MNLYLISSFCLILATKVYGDELDDLRASYIEKLLVINDQALTVIVASEHTLDETDLYINTAHQVFSTDGTTRIDNQIAAINETAAELTLDAILNNKPAKVLTCISDARRDGEVALDKLLQPYLEKMGQLVLDNTANFNQQRDTIQLVKSQLDGLFISNSDKINTCVVESCFESDLSAAATQYTNLQGSVTSIVEDVKNARASFNDKAINLVDNMRDDAQSAVDSADKKMGKC